MAVKKVLHKIWHIVKPILWFGLTLGISKFSKKTGVFEDQVNTAGTAIGTAIVEEIDEALDNEDECGKD